MVGNGDSTSGGANGRPWGNRSPKGCQHYSMFGQKMLSGFLDSCWNSSLASESSANRLLQQACELGQQNVSGSGEGLKSDSTRSQVILKQGQRNQSLDFCSIAVCP